jgi:hypothetical protein
MKKCIKTKIAKIKIKLIKYYKLFNYLNFFFIIFLSYKRDKKILIN